MTFDFEKTMKEAPDAELIRIVVTNRDDYQEAAIAAAEAELSKRNLPEETLSIIESRQIEENAERIHKANFPLELHWKILTFIFPGIFQLIIAGFFKANGFDRRANEVGEMDDLRSFVLYRFSGLFRLVETIPKQLWHNATANNLIH